MTPQLSAGLSVVVLDACMWNRGKRQNIGQSVWQFRMVVCQVADNPLEIGEDGFNGRKVRRVRWKMEKDHIIGS